MFLNDKLITGWEWPEGMQPHSYGWFHITWLVIMVFASFMLAYFIGRKHDKKKDDAVIFTLGTILLISEIYKQIFYTIDAGYYQWYVFPFQFCSVPMFVAFIAPLLKDGKVKEAMYRFLAFFGLLAGIAVMLYPGDCLNTDRITICCHSMQWHALMVVMGVYLIVSKNFASSIKNILKEVLPGFYVYCVIVAIAVIANIVAYNTYFKYPELNIYNQTFWLLYISPYYSTPIPVLGTIKEVAPYPVFLGLYLVAFILGVSVIWSLVFGTNKLVSKVAELGKAKEKEAVYA